MVENHVEPMWWCGSHLDPMCDHVDPMWWCVNVVHPTHVLDILYTPVQYRNDTDTGRYMNASYVVAQGEVSAKDTAPPDVQHGLRGSTASPLARSFAAPLPAAPEPQPHSVSAFHEPGGHPLFPDAYAWGGRRRKAWHSIMML